VEREDGERVLNKLSSDPNLSGSGGGVGEFGNSPFDGSSLIGFSEIGEDDAFSDMGEDGEAAGSAVWMADVRLNILRKRSLVDL
jgi:hypothetical protein